MTEQKVITGEHSILHVKNLIQQNTDNRILILAGSHLQHDLVFADFLKSFEGFSIKCLFHQSGVRNDIEKLYPLTASALEYSPGVLIAVGGGGVLDATKFLVKKIYENSGKKPVFIAVPTSAGSGSEATSFAVVYKDGEKTSLADPLLLPDAVCLDSDLLKSTSREMRAISGADAICQAIESIWNTYSTNESLAYAGESLSISLNYYLSMVNDNDPLSRTQMGNAAYLSGKAINITRTTGPHALSYFLTARFGVPHGQAVALFLPLFFYYNFNEESIEGLDVARRQKLLTAFAVLKKIIMANDYNEAAVKIKTLFNKAGLSTDLKSLNVPASAKKDILLQVNAERFNNNPVPFNEQKLIQLMENI